MPAKNAAKEAKKLLLRLRKEDSCKVRIFLDEKLFIANALINRWDSRCFTGLPVSEVNASNQIAPFIRPWRRSWSSGLWPAMAKKVW
jgi:hypothetical protein